MTREESRISSGFAKSDWCKLGRTDLTISPIGLGTVKFGRNTGVKYPSSFSLPDDSQLDALLQTAKEQGINLLDTAPAYGESEKKIGEMIKGDRTHWVISTKVGEQYENGASSYDFSANATRRSVEHSLRCLKTDYLDIVLIHLDDEDEAALRHSEVVGELVLLKEKGLIRSIGASTKTVAGGLLALDLTDLVMVTVNPQDISQSPVVERARELGKGVIAKKALASGHASNIRENLDFVLGNRSICSAFVGTINPQHLIQNVQDALTILR